MAPLTVHLIAETHHYLDWQNRWDETTTVDPDHGVYANRADADAKAAQLNTPLREWHQKDEKEREARMLAEARKVRSRNEDRQVLRDAGRRTDADEPIPAFQPRPFELWRRTRDSWDEYEVVTVDVQ